MSALPSTSDLRRRTLKVRFVPNSGSRRRGRRVTPEVLLCGGRRYTFESAIDRQSIQKCENWVRARADGPRLPSLLLHDLDGPGMMQGYDKRPKNAGSCGWPSWP